MNHTSVIVKTITSLQRVNNVSTYFLIFALRVEIFSLSYFFPCQRWLDTDKDDGQIYRILVPVDKSFKKKLGRKDSMAIRNELALEMQGIHTIDTNNDYSFIRLLQTT